MSETHDAAEECWPSRVEHANARDILIEYIAGAGSHALASLYSFVSKKSAELLIDGKPVCRYVNGQPWWELETHDAIRLSHLHAAAPELLAACRLLAAMEDGDVSSADTRWKQARKDMRAAIAKAEGRGE